MPLPNTTDIGKLLRFLKKDKPNMSHKQRLAIAIKHIKKQNEELTGKARMRAISIMRNKK